MADARSPVEVAAALRTWLTEEFGGPVDDLEMPAPSRGGRATLVHLMRFDGVSLPAAWRAPLVVRIHQSPDDAEASAREASIQEWCSARGYPVPRVVALFGPGDLLDLPVQVMQRAPGVTMLAAVRRKPWRALAFVETLARLQLRLHRLPTDSWPEGPGSRLAERRVARARRVASNTNDADLNEALANVDRMLPDLNAGPPVPCHGDFHPMNVLVAGSRSSVIDWSDAALGDRHGDVARTSWLIRYGPSTAGMSRLEREGVMRTLAVLSRRYLAAYQREHALDPRLLRRWETLQLLDSWGHAVEAMRGSDSPNDADRMGLVWVREQLAAALA